MSYNLLIGRNVQKVINQLPTKIYHQVKDLIADLAQTPRPLGCLKLSGEEAWRIRVGDYRVVYEVDDKKQTVSIIQVGHRRDVYNKK